MKNLLKCSFLFLFLMVALTSVTSACNNVDQKVSTIPCVASSISVVYDVAPVNDVNVPLVVPLQSVTTYTQSPNEANYKIYVSDASYRDNPQNISFNKHTLNIKTSGTSTANTYLLSNIGYSMANICNSNS